MSPFLNNFSKHRRSKIGLLFEKKDTYLFEKEESNQVVA